MRFEGCGWLDSTRKLLGNLGGLVLCVHFFEEWGTGSGRSICNLRVIRWFKYM